LENGREFGPNRPYLRGEKRKLPDWCKEILVLKKGGLAVSG